MIRIIQQLSNRMRSNAGMVTTNIIALLALSLGIYQYYKSDLPKDTKLTIKSSPYKKCFSGDVECNQVFIYNNDEAPCFEFQVSYKKNDFDDVKYEQGYDKSRLLDAKIQENGSLGFPAMLSISLNDKMIKNGNQSAAWLGVLNTKDIVYLAAFPKNPNKQNELKISCVDYEKILVLQPRNQQ